MNMNMNMNMNSNNDKNNKNSGAWGNAGVPDCVTAEDLKRNSDMLRKHIEAQIPVLSINPYRNTDKLKK